MALLVVVPSSAAWAVRAGDYVGNGINIRTGTSTGNTIVGKGYVGQGICVWYTAHGQSVNGSTLWGNHTNRATGVRGWSSATHLGIYNTPGAYCA